MTKKPTYDELEQKVRKLEKQTVGRKMAEEELRRSEELHRIILTNLSDTVLITDTTGKFTYVCPNVNIIFGYSSDEIIAHENIGKLFGNQLIKVDDFENLKEIVNIEKEITDKWGRNHTLLINVKKVAIDDGTFLYACRDITERKQAERALQKAHDELEGRVRERTEELTKTNELLTSEIEERKLADFALRKSEVQKKAILDASIDSIRYIDKNMKILWANKASAIGTNITAEELIGKWCYELYVGKNKPCEGCPTVKAMETGQIERAILRYSKLLGTNGERYVDNYCVPMKNDEGAIEGLVQVSRDISGLKHAEEQIHSLTHQLIKAQDSERQMISRELHDSVAQELSSLKIAFEMIWDNQPELSSQARQKFAEMSDALQRVIVAVRDLSYDLRPSGLDELGLVEVASQYCEEFSKKSGIKIEFNAAGLGNLERDFDTEINLYRILQEGLNNILKHAAAGHARINLVGAFPNIILGIEDNGIGFDVNDVFTDMKHGKRMGLKSMQERTRLLNGKMVVQSRSMKGTKITIKIPYKEIKNGSKKDHIDR